MEVPFTGRQFSLDPTHGVQLSSLPLLCYATPNPFPGGNPLAGGDCRLLWEGEVEQVVSPCTFGNTALGPTLYNL